jgi:hypothetical protein
MKPKYFQTITISTGEGECVGHRVGGSPRRTICDTTVVAVEHEAPDQPGRDVGKNVRQEKDHPESDGAGELVGKQHRHGQRQGKLDRHRYDDDQQVVDERPAEDPVAQQLREVLEAGEIRRYAGPFQL